MAASAASLNIVNSYYQAILRFQPSSSLAQVFAAQLDAGTLTQSQLETQLLSSAQSTTIPAILTYDLFYNTTPNTSGVTYLAHYAAALESGNYISSPTGFQLGTTAGQFNSAQFSLQNVYVNLGASFASDPNSTFKATYGALPAATFVNQVYTQIFGFAPAADTQQFLLGALPYYTNYAGSTLGGYGAIAGLLLSVAEGANLGPYPAAANSFLGTAAVTSAAGTDTAPYGQELIASAPPPGPGEAATVLTTAVDHVTANTILGDLTPFLFNGIGPTLNVGDTLNGVAGATNNTFDINDEFGTGTDVVPAGVFINNVQNIDLTTQGNAGGASPLSQALGIGPGTASGVFDVTSTSSTQASTITGVKNVNVLSAGQAVDNVRVDPGVLNPVNVAVIHQHVNGVGGVAILGGNNITVSDGDGNLANALAANADLTSEIFPLFGSDGFDGDEFLGIGPLANAGVNIGSATVVNTNNIDLNPTGTVTVSEIGNNQIIVNGGTTVAIRDAGGGAIQVGQNTGAQLSYPSDEPVGAVDIVDNANTQAGPIVVFGAAPTANGTLNTTSANITETALLAGGIGIGNLSATGGAGVLESYSPAGNDTVTVQAGTPVAYDFIGGVQAGITAIGLAPIVIIGGATDAVTTNANSVFIGGASLNGLTPVVNQNATGNVTVVDTAVVGLGAGGAAVTVEAGQNVAINAAGGAVTIGTPIPGANLTIAPTGTETVIDTAPRVYDNVINTGSFRDVTLVGGTSVGVQTNAGAVTIGTPVAIPGSEPTSTVSVVDTATPGVNNKYVVKNLENIYTISAVTPFSTYTLFTAGNPDGYAIVATAADTPVSIAATLAAVAAADGSATVTASGPTLIGVGTGGAAAPTLTGPGVGAPQALTVPSDVPINIFGGTNVAANSANGAITIGFGTTGSNPTGNVTAITSGIETGGQFASTTAVNGGVNVAINTTGAGGAVTAGFAATPTTGTPITGTVAIIDSFSGTQNADSFAVIGGAGSPAVSITTTKSSGAIAVGAVAPALTTAGTALSNSNVFANGNVNIVNETPAGTGVAGATNLWGTGATLVNTFGGTTVNIAGGGTTTITDEATTPATGSNATLGVVAGQAVGKSTLATVNLDHVGTGGLASTITSDALTALSVVDDTAGDTYNLVATPALALALTIGNDAAVGKTTTIGDATATAINVTDNGKATAGTLALATPAATSASFTTTAAGTLTVNLAVPGAVDTKLTSITAANAGGLLNLGDLSKAPNVVVTAGAASTGGVTIGNPLIPGSGLAATASFNGAGSTGNDTITLLGNITKGVIQAGGGTTNTIIANYGAGAGDVALSSEVHGFQVLGVGPLAGSRGRQDVITVAALGGIASNPTFTISVPGVAPGTATFTYAQQTGDTTATVAAALVTGLNARLAAAGEPAFAALQAPGSNVILVTSTFGAPVGVNLTTVTGTNGAAITDAQAAGGAAGPGNTFNAYNATGFTALKVGTISGPVTFSGVSSNEALIITDNPGSAITLAPSAPGNNALTITEGVDGPATGPTKGTAGLTAIVNTLNTPVVAVVSQGNGTTTNTLTLSDPALISLSIAGDESLTVFAPATNVAVPGTGAADSAFSQVTGINAANFGGGTTISTNPGAKNVTDASGVVVSAAGVNVIGGASLMKAQGAQGNDFVVQSSTITLDNPDATPPVAPITFTAGEVASVTLTSLSGYSKGSVITVNYTVQPSDLPLGSTPAQQDANVAADLAGAINAAAAGIYKAGFGTGAGPGITAATLTINGTDNSQTFTVTDSFGAPVSAPASTPNGGVFYTQARDTFVAGTGGGVFTLGTGGGFNPFATVTLPPVPPAVTSTTYQGLYDTGFEKVTLSGSTVSDTIVVNPSVISTFGGAAGSNNGGGITGFKETPTTTADTLNYPAANTYTVLANTTAPQTLTSKTDSNIANTLDPSGGLANTLALLSYTSSDGLITVINNGNQQSPTGETLLETAEIIVATTAATLGEGVIAAVSDNEGGTYVVAATATNTFATYAPSLVVGGVLNTAPGTFNPGNDGLSAVQLLGDGTFTGFGSSNTVPVATSITAPPGLPAAAGLTAGLGATGAVLANVINQLPSPGGIFNTGGAVYNDTGFSLDALTADKTASTSYTNLAPASQLNIADPGGTVGAVIVTQTGASGSNSLIVDFQSADTIASLTTTGDWAIKLVADANTILKSLTDSTGLVTTLPIVGAANLEIDSVAMSGLATVDATKLGGVLTFGKPAVVGPPFIPASPINIANLVIKGSLGGDVITDSGATNTITVGTTTAAILGNVTVTATGNGDKVTLVNSNVFAVNNLNVGSPGDTISVDTGTNNISGGAVIAPTALFPLGLQVPLQSNDTINLADGGTDNVWVGGGSTIVNLTGNQGTTTFGAPTTAFNKGGIPSFANIQVTGDTAGTNSSGFATGGSGALTTITGVDLAGGTPLSLTFLNAGVGGTEALASGGGADGAFVNIQGAATLSAALDADVNASMVYDAQAEPGVHTKVVAGTLDLAPKTGLISWFQYSGNTYVVEATNTTASNAAHAGLQAGDTVVKLTGLVDLSGATFAGGTLSQHFAD